MKTVTLALVLAGSALSTAANADSPATSTLSISAVVPNSCTLATGSDAVTLDLGNITPDTQQDSLPATVSFTCTNGTTYSVTADDGLNASTPGARQLTGSNTANLLAYTLLQGTTGNTPFANLTGQTSDGTAQSLSFRVRIPAAAAGTYRTADSYSDKVTLSIAY